MSNTDPRAVEVLDFWFGHTEEARPEWFRKDERFDAEIARLFGALVDEAVAGRLAAWGEASAETALALVILLDQFPRNMHRGSPLAFRGDAAALATARRMVERDMDLALPPVRRAFAYLPFEHAEDLAAQDEAVRLFTLLAAEAPPLADMLDYAHRHRDVIARFGRFPHRNEVLQRQSTPEEIEFLKQPGSRF